MKTKTTLRGKIFPMFPTHLQQLRKLSKLTQNELATALNKNRRTGESRNSANQIGNWERGERHPSLDEIRKLADYFNVSADYLIGRNENQNINLQELFLSGALLNFGERELSPSDRHQIYLIIENYINGEKRTILTDDIPIDYQIELNFNENNNE